MLNRTKSYKQQRARDSRKLLLFFCKKPHKKYIKISCIAQKRNKKQKSYNKNKKKIIMRIMSVVVVEVFFIKKNPCKKKRGRKNVKAKI